MRRDREAIFLDTTYILPFFGVKLDIQGAEELEKTLSGYDELHISETSLLESKAKLLRLAIKDPSFEATVQGFGKNLDFLRGDERVIFHRYTGLDDRRFNIINTLSPRLNFFDEMILAESISVGCLLTEDEMILSLSRNPEFHARQEFDGFRVLRLRDLVKGIG